MVMFYAVDYHTWWRLDADVCDMEVISNLLHGWHSGHGLATYFQLIVVLLPYSVTNSAYQAIET